jgi:flavodoxin
MKTLVIYDSAFGNTEQIARAVGGALGAPDEVRVVRVGDASPEQLAGVALLVVGSPTQKFRPLPAVSSFLKSVPAGALNGVKVAAFDTRADLKTVNSAVLNFFVKLFGYAAEPMAAQLKKKGGTLIAPPEGFFVVDTQGPLKEGELERAAAWAKRLR